ncbi:protein phosphatase 2C domain-containing protein [Larkinella terrae]|uniref:protein phosphatase 2C domain-containing protein n=1 Tax=Larkinella terrae TaxID=2025311 RepID=UPI001478CB4A|nr:protein phosphatase 2C domain-containing protein [Larkinella terrae]
MKLTIHQPLGYSFQGGRSNNEDTIFPLADDATQQQPWFMVCDGVGGAARGEIASHIAVEGFNDYFIRHPEPVATPVYLQAALDYVQAQFDDYLARHPEGNGMATTLTLLYLHEAGASVAHIGDSRVYHLRNGKVIWRTEDHSLVNQLLKAGVISREEAREHPQRNVIERAIQGSTKPVKIDVQVLNDVRPGDYFFLCTDGVLERVSDELLENVLGTTTSNEEKKQMLVDCCTGKTKDNFSAYLVQIETVSGDVADEYRFSAPVYALPETVADETVAVVAVDSVRTAPAEDQIHPRVSPEPRSTAVPPRKFDEPASTDRPSPDTDSLSRLLTVALLAAVLTLGGVMTYKWAKSDKTGQGQGAGTAQRQTKPKPEIDVLPPNTTPDSDSRKRADEVSQAVISAGKAPVLIAGKLYKKPTEDGWMLVDEKGEKKRKTKVYDEIGKASDNFVPVRKDTKWGYIDLEGRVMIWCQFDKAGDFAAGRALVSKGGQEYYIDKTGQVAQPAESAPGQETAVSKADPVAVFIHPSEEFLFNHIRS